MSGVVRQGQANVRGKQYTSPALTRGGGGRRQQPQNNNNNNNRNNNNRNNNSGPRGQQQKVQRGGASGQRGGRQEKPKRATAEDLDKALDAYMMKDPKTAQIKLDEEITSYMDEAGDILMDL
ncbi:hypothetical protein J3Q64DRAFT_1288295 [Phycomyces blakesleeanus]